MCAHTQYRFVSFVGSFFGSGTTVHCCSLRFMWKIRLLVSVSVAAVAVVFLIVVVVALIVGLVGVMKTVL